MNIKSEVRLRQLWQFTTILEVLRLWCQSHRSLISLPAFLIDYNPVERGESHLSYFTFFSSVFYFSSTISSFSFFTEFHLLFFSVFLDWLSSYQLWNFKKCVTLWTLIKPSLHRNSSELVLVLMVKIQLVVMNFIGLLGWRMIAWYFEQGAIPMLQSCQL